MTLPCLQKPRFITVMFASGCKSCSPESAVPFCNGIGKGGVLRICSSCDELNGDDFFGNCPSEEIPLNSACSALHNNSVAAWRKMPVPLFWPIPVACSLETLWAATAATVLSSPPSLLSARRVCRLSKEVTISEQAPNHK